MSMMDPERMDHPPIITEATRQQLITELCQRSTSIIIAATYDEADERHTIFVNEGDTVGQIGLCDIMSRRLDRIAEGVADATMPDEWAEEGEEEDDDGDE